MISVIIPVYNLENYIERTIKSVCAQTYKDLEIIVVDDGSADKSLEIINALAEEDSRIKPIHQENGGVTKARMNGVANASGEWIGFVDGDDEIEADMYELLMKNAIDYNADISHCGYKMVFDDGRVNEFHGTGQIVEQDNIKGQIDILVGALVEPGLWNKIYKKSLFDALVNEEIDYTIKNNEDLLINYYLFKHADKSVFEDICKYNYIVRQGSASRRVSKNTIYDPIRVKQLIMQDAGEGVLPTAQRVYLSTCVTVYSSLTVSENADKEDIKCVRKKIKEAKEYKNLLGKRTKLLFSLIYYCPAIFKIFYRIYSKHFQIKKYS